MSCSCNLRNPFPYLNHTICFEKLRLRWSRDFSFIETEGSLACQTHPHVIYFKSWNFINVISHSVAYQIPCPETSYAVSSVRPNCVSMPLQLVLLWFPDGILWVVQVTVSSFCRFTKTTYHALFFLYFVTSEMGRSDLCLFVFCEVETSFAVSFNLDPFFNISPLFFF